MGEPEEVLCGETEAARLGLRLVLRHAASATLWSLGSLSLLSSTLAQLEAASSSRELDGTFRQDCFLRLWSLSGLGSVYL